MPAPLARGILLSLSLLIAAGIAVYENPQIREWIEDNRRKLALALHGLGDDVHPSSSWGRDDVSLREDNSPEAVERRRQARQAILDRAREIHASRGLPMPTHRRGESFDDLVDDDGNLRQRAAEAIATGANVHDTTSRAQLRSRATEAAGVAAGAAAGVVAANPFADEMVMSYNSGLTEEEALERATRESETESEAASLHSALSDIELQALVDRELQKVDRLRLHVDTDLASRSATLEADDGNDARSESEVLVELTPTTSRAPSSFHPAVLTPRTPRTPVARAGNDEEDSAAALSFDGTPVTPRSAASGAALVVEEPTEMTLPLAASTSSALSAADFQSIHHWAAATSSANFYSPPQSVTASMSEASMGEMAGLEESLARNRDVGGADKPAEATRGGTPQAHNKTAASKDGDEDVEVLSAADARSEAPSDAELISHGSATPGEPWSEIGSVVSDEEH